MKKVVFLLLLAACAQAQTPFIQELAFGKYPVGFQTFFEYDNTRPAVQEQKVKDKGRLLQINVWYPASKKGKETMRFKDYVHLVGKELDADNPSYKQDGIAKYFAWPVSAGTSQSDIDAFLNQNISLSAVRGSSIANGPFPVVMLVHGFAVDYAFLGEYLASMGFIAVHVPVKGTTTYELDYGLQDKGLETQVLDYEYAIKIVAQKFKQAQTAETGVIAFSFGGQSALGMAIRNSNIKAVVSLDGGIGSDFGGVLLSKQAFYDVNKINAPILHLYNPNDPYTDLKWLNTYKSSKRTLVALKSVAHGHFTSFGLLDNQIPYVIGKNEPRPGKAYEAIMLYTQTFLDKHLNNKPSDLATLRHKKWVTDCIQSFKELS
ncbi:MAG: dienelactone hydrolase family protein [Saprospiraceae bacterium]|nr:dienelactone hydrolase family protein [Saprospiraceae bacterium]